jgi:hypothetical protein
MRGKFVLCRLCDPHPLIPTGWKNLVDDHDGYERAPGGWVWYPRRERHLEEDVDERILLDPETLVPLGRPVKGILDENTLMDAINSGLASDPERVARVNEIIRDPRDVLTRSQVRELRELLVGGVPEEKLNTKTVAAHYGIKERAARDLVRAANSTIGREADSMPLTKADMNELREELEERYEALHADVRATLAVVLERFPNSNAVAAAVDEFLDDTLRD